MDWLRDTYGLWVKAYEDQLEVEAGEVVVLYPRGRVADGVAVTAREATLGP